MECTKNENEYPIIGILTQKSVPVQEYIEQPCSSFIAASYVKYVESAGARVVPIMIGKEESYYEDILSKINGILLPGGAEWFNEKDGYADAGYFIYKIAKKLNDDGIHFPILGICLGYELLIYLSANKSEHRDDCENLGNSYNINFKEGFRSSKLFKGMDERLVTIFSNECVATFYHRFCITEKVLNRLDLDDKWRVLATNTDKNGLEFLTAIESIKYPFYGLQFHPEKNIFEWYNNYNVNHSMNAIKANRYFAEFLISESRRNMNKFSDILEEKENLIYNKQIVYTGLKCNRYMQCYIFNNE